MRLVFVCPALMALAACAGGPEFITRSGDDLSISIADPDNLQKQLNEAEDMAENYCRSRGKQARLVGTDQVRQRAVAYFECHVPTVGD